MPVLKGTNYFIDCQMRALKQEDDYEKFFNGRTTEKAVGEVSAAYLYDKDVPGRILERLGKVKIIIILRNPVSMIYSLWAYNVNKLGR